MSEAMKFTATDVRKALRVRYCPPEWCLCEEVANASGAGPQAYADAVAFSIWPSRGYGLQGFEIKVSRSDFLAEMRKPAKADAVGAYCDQWWLVTPPRLVDPAEIPPTWGLMEMTGAGLRVKQQAPRQEPKPLNRAFAAALVRRARDLTAAHVAESIEAGNADRERRMQEEMTRRIADRSQRLAAAEKWRAEFEAAFGQDYPVYSDPKAFAESVKLAQSLAGEWGSLRAVRAAASRLVQEVDAVAAFNAKEPQP